ncbi:Bpu10I family restriction endonuclease [Microcoleus sp. FACHB-68]|uniref:Bpu10I family restriction endonuclease n=1 Tax=Microcoleus sp. FACHB-68 TaxID=2692826 RepID=UPI0018EFC0C5|nr:Bpu10I family restriction endonuclease [Microcoleus sp. FACHB-68]
MLNYTESYENRLRNKEGWQLKEFDKPIPQERLDIIEKTRSNLFAWRGQFSPQLIEVILNSYCLSNSVILEPFAGSGTVLLEAGTLAFEAYGFEINPAAWILSKTYEFINSSKKKEVLKIIRNLIDREFPFRIFENGSQVPDITEKLRNIRSELDEEGTKIFDALIILLDVANNKITNEFIQNKFADLTNVIEKLPYSEKQIKVGLSDARSLPLKNDQIDFVVTSPPYINVFNYHQNYRRSAELLGWDLLKIAKSEIGSNRANRGNRFYTVIQYCLDMADTLRELSRVTKHGGRIVFVVGHESNVLGVPFYNADIIEKIGIRANLFHRALRQKREFKNKFGKVIREDLINFFNLNNNCNKETAEQIAREVAFDLLKSGLSLVSAKNLKSLEDAIDKVQDIGRTPILDKRWHIYQSRQSAQLASPQYSQSVQSMPELSRPHYTKLTACLSNRRLPEADKERLEEAVIKYHNWIAELEAIERGQADTVEKLVKATNRYKRFIELDLIFDSSDNFLYRQKGQLKLDNTILEEFLPQVVFRSLRGIDDSFELGPRNTFSGLSFLSSLGNLGQGGEPSIRTKDQDFILGKRLYLKSSFDPEFKNYKLIESHLGYVCAECKTNLDKTMFQEAVATSRDLKIAVPGSLYFLICEFLDMTPISIISTQIDDVLIVRKTKRLSSNIRQEYRTPEERQLHRQEYVDFLDSSRYYPDVFQRMIDKIQALIDDTSPSMENVLDQGHF